MLPTSSGAVCLDGSPAGFYLFKAPAGTKRFKASNNAPADGSEADPQDAKSAWAARRVLLDAESSFLNCYCSSIFALPC